MLQERYSPEELKALFVPRAEWKPFPPAADRESWEALQAHPLNQRRKAYLTGYAEGLLGQPWPPLTAVRYMDVVRNGDRRKYEQLYFRRRLNLQILVLAECMEHRGRFLDEIINGIWATTEEATWCIPAHPYRDDLPGGGQDPLVSQARETTDLFACETAALLAEESFLLTAELDAIAPSVRDRIRRQTLQRVIEPVERDLDQHFMRATANWSPWCSSNALTAAMHHLDDPDRLAAIAHKLMGFVDNFITDYADERPDGGCTEGPGYWQHAGGTLLVFLELLRSRSNGAIDLYDEPLIANMGRYLVKAHLAGDRFANFADCPSLAGRLNSGSIYRFGERIGSEAMKDLALLSLRGWRGENEVDPPLRPLRAQMLRELFWIPPDAWPGEYRKSRVDWLPDSQILVCRESEVFGQGLLLAAKGGHNAEPHNHNDLGQFIVMLDGQCAIVDPGRGVYRRETFGKERYAFWFINSSGHNVPLVNGCQQATGREHAATGVEFREEDDGARTLGMNLESAYGEEAGLESLRRTIAFRRSPSVSIRVTDAYAMKDAPPEIAIPLHTPLPHAVRDAGRIVFDCGGRELELEFDPDLFRLETETVDLRPDSVMRAIWGDTLTRLRLIHDGKENAGEYALTFRANG